MKKLIAALGVLVIAALMSVGLVGTAQAVDYGDVGGVDGGTTPQGVSTGSGESTSTGSGSAAGQSSAGVLPATGGPETALLVGGVALLAVGGVALAANRRRSHDS